MTRRRSLEELTLAFERLGMEEPEAWARSQTTEGINQLGRALMLKAVWRAILDERDPDWLAEIEGADTSEEPFGMLASAQRILKTGADPADLLMVIREFQFRTAFDICCAMDGTAEAEDDFGMSWTLVEEDLDTGRLGSPIDGLGESLLETDPTGLEMKPLRAEIK